MNIGDWQEVTIPLKTWNKLAPFLKEGDLHIPRHVGGMKLTDVVYKLEHMGAIRYVYDIGKVEVFEINPKLSYT